MANVNRYIGARYVPKFADPMIWDDTKTYEPLTIVLYMGNSYTSKRDVPVGASIADQDYWAPTGNYSAQVEAYRQEVQTFDNRITTNANDIASESETRADEDNRLYTNLSGSIGDVQTIANAAQDAADAAQETADEALAAAQVAAKKTHIAFIGDSFSDASGECASIVANALGYSLINMASAGAGFTTGGYKFIEQLQDLILDPNFENVDTIFVYGGINDWNDAHASTSQMQSAFNDFKVAYLAIPAAKRPRIIFAFGNVGMSTQARYDGFLYWQRECVRILRSGVCMPGVVDNVCMWLMGFNGSSCFESDNLHPSAAGQRAIASYLMSLYNGCYNGVFRQFTGSSSIGTGLNVDGTFNNGVVSISVKGEGVTLPTTSGYTEIASVGSRQLTFGGDQSSAGNQNLITSVPIGVYADSNGHTAQQQLVFNTRNGNLYVQNFGTVSLIPTGSRNLDTVLCGMPIS